MAIQFRVQPKIK